MTTLGLLHSTKQIVVNNPNAVTVYTGKLIEVMDMLTELAKEEVIYLSDLTVRSRMELYTLIDMIQHIKKKWHDAEKQLFTEELNSILLSANIRPQLTA